MNKRSKFIAAFEIAFLMVALAGLLFVSMNFGFSDSLKPDTTRDKWIMMIGIVIMGFIVLAAHELGHLITGLMNGFRFDLFVVGPLGVKRENDKVKVYLNKNLAYYGGVAGTSPIHESKDNAKKFAYVLLAGPIASIIFAIICFTISYFAGKPIGIIFYTGGMISIAIFFATTIPSRTGMFFTDRKRYQRLVTPGKDQQVELAILNIIVGYAKENSYKDIKIKDIEMLISDELPFMKFFGLYNLVCYQLEMDGEIKEKTLQEYNSHSTTMSKNIINAFNKEIEKLKEQLKTES